MWILPLFNTERSTAGTSQGSVLGSLPSVTSVHWWRSVLDSIITATFADDNSKLATGKDEIEAIKD